MAAFWLMIRRWSNLIHSKGVSFIYMRSRFWNGLLAGSVLGVVAAWLIAPQRKPSRARKVMGRSRQMQSQARRIMRKVREGVSDLMD
jgi:gas vesicle protein